MREAGHDILSQRIRSVSPVCVIAVLFAISSPAGVAAHAHRRPPIAHRQPASANDDTSGAIPAASARHMPGTAAQYRALQEEIAKSRPEVVEAQQKSAQLKSEADALRRQLIDTAAQVQTLEREGVW